MKIRARQIVFLSKASVFVVFSHVTGAVHCKTLNVAECTKTVLLKDQIQYTPDWWCIIYCIQASRWALNMNATRTWSIFFILVFYVKMLNVELCVLPSYSGFICLPVYSMFYCLLYTKFGPLLKGKFNKNNVHSSKSVGDATAHVEVYLNKWLVYALVIVRFELA